MRYSLMLLVGLFCLTSCDSQSITEKKAVAGDAQAQYELGVMYEAGKGVPKDTWEAMKWYRKAAEQGHALAQNNLGVMYKMGSGVPQDFVEAYAWVYIAAAQGNEMAIETRDLFEKLMGRDSLEKAQERSREYFDKYVVPFW